jgi:hypothetical protein
MEVKHLDSGLSAVAVSIQRATVLSKPERIATAAGTDTYTATVGVSRLVIGDEYKIKIANANTLANPTLNLDSIGAKTIVDPLGTSLTPGQLNGEHIFRWNGTNMLVLNPNRALVIAVGRNIAARTDASVPNTKLNISADRLMLEDSNGNCYLARSVSVSIDFTTTGANALDTGTQVLSTWYYGWVIAKADGTIAGLGSTSSSAPTMPSGYTFKALVTAARSDASVHFIKYRQTGNEAFYEARQGVLVAGAATVETSVSTATLVPPIAEAVRLSTALSTTGGAISTSIRVVSGSDIILVDANSVTTGITEYIIASVPNVGQNILYINGGANGSNTTFVLAYKLPVGGE